MSHDRSGYGVRPQAGVAGQAWPGSSNAADTGIVKTTITVISRPPTAAATTDPAVGWRRLAWRTARRASRIWGFESTSLQVFEFLERSRPIRTQQP